METVWFALIALMIILYVIFDGFDLGAGMVQPLVARTAEEKRLILRTIGPVWDGNEVWLLAAGGSLYFAFPLLYASGLSGFYLPIMIALWLLILRGIAIEFRNHLDGPIWAPFWDAIFALASALLALTFGAALGNVIRGVPLNDAGTFFVPLWTDLRVGPEPGALDWYTALVALTAASALLVHGASWVAMKAPVELAPRARAVAWRSWWLVAVLTLVVTIATFNVQPQISIALARNPLGFLCPALALSGLVAGLVHTRGRADVLAFLASILYLIGMLASVFVGLYPLVLPSSSDPMLALTIENAAAGEYGLRVALWWWIPGFLLVASYFVLTYRHFRGRVNPQAEGH